ncbi:extracellular solute-binding protein [uncultured Vagococcus sp.]|uniref:extracellular solute-binding protein n=1 Tax=uncultured Vagococcus sp. TaxID=189676 RepID=UPI0028D3172E|nr:extracellular solute-binding protein [uncultured Vagococcus sp.]
MKKKLLLGLVFGTVLLTTLAACGDKEKEATKESGKTEIKVTWRDTGEVDTLRTYLENFAEKFEKENDDIKLVLSPITASEGDYFSKVALSMQSESTAPDVVAEDTFMLNSDANAGYLLPLDDKVKDWSEWPEYTENLKAGSTGEDGVLYAIPGVTDSRGLWYNKNVFKEVGLPVDWQPKNWEEIMDAAKIVKEKAPKVIPFSMSVAKANGESVSMQTFEMLLYGTKDTLFDADTKKWNVNTAGIEDSLTFVDDVYNKEKVGPSLSVAMNSNYGSVLFQEKFPNDEAAIILDGIWNIGNYKSDGVVPIDNATERFGFAAMPTQNGEAPGTTTMAGGWSWSIPKKSKNHEESWRVIQALGTKDEQADRALAQGNLTVRGDAAEVPAYKEVPFMAEATELLENAYFRPANDKYPNVSTEIQNMVEAVASGSKTPKEAAKQYADNVTRIVGKENVKE